MSLAEKFIANVAYLADIVYSLNFLNQSMQGAGFTVINHVAKITAYYKKVILWQTYVNRDEFGMFSQLENYIARKNINVKDTIIGHLEKLSKKVEHYYSYVWAWDVAGRLLLHCARTARVLSAHCTSLQNICEHCTAPHKNKIPKICRQKTYCMNLMICC